MECEITTVALVAPGPDGIDIALADSDTLSFGDGRHPFADVNLGLERAFARRGLLGKVRYFRSALWPHGYRPPLDARLTAECLEEHQDKPDDWDWDIHFDWDPIAPVEAGLELMDG